MANSRTTDYCHWIEAFYFDPEALSPAVVARIALHGGRPEVSIQRRSTDSMRTRYLGFGSAGAGGVADGADLVALQAAGPALVGAALLRGSDALGLALTDELALKLGKGAHHVQLERSHRIRVPGLEGQPLLEELDTRSLPGALLGVLGRIAGDLLDDVIEIDDRPGQAIHRRDDDMVATADMPDQRLQLRALRRVLAGLLFGEGLVALPHRLQLPREVLAGR